jgi:hypothetical protein
MHIDIPDILTYVNFALSLGLTYVFARLVIKKQQRMLKVIFGIGFLTAGYTAAIYGHLFATGSMLSTEYTRIAFTLTLALLLSAAINELYYR